MHFRGKNSAMKPLFELLIRRLQESGALRVDAVKTSINLVSKHHFGGVLVRGGYLRVGFLTKKMIRSPRIVHTEVLGPNRVAHSIEVRTAADVDDELLHWLSDARAMQS